jgi:hypothetical protein
MDSNMPSHFLGVCVPDDNKCDAVTWPFPNQPPEHEPLHKLPFNIDNYEDAPL